MSDHATFWDTFLEKTHLGENLDGMLYSAGVGYKINPSGIHHTHEGELQFGHVLGSLVVFGILGYMGYASRARLSNTAEAVVPEDKLTVASFVELIVETIYKQMANIMGREAAKYFLPLIGSLAFFILFSNALGLIPGLTPPTNKLSTTIVLALIVFFSTHIYGLKHNGLGHVKHLFGPWLGVVGIPLNLLMFLIECVSHLVRPASLSIRLAGNLTADHAVLGAFLAFGAASFLLVPLPMYILGCLVVLVQTAVFCLLSTVYISMAIAHEEH
jgi:F-type H+-transporting ATPase subunit a